MGKSPAFQAYPGAWLASSTITMMTPAEEGAYWRLLCYAWLDENCSIPDDDAVLATLSRLGQGWLANGCNQSSTVIRKCFIPHPTIPGRLINERLMMEREKQEQWREKSKQGGIKSANAKRYKVKGGWQMVVTKRQPKVGAPVEPLVNSLSLSVHCSEDIGHPSSIDEVKLRAAKIGLPDTEAEKFFHYYESNGWKVGRNKMKSWHGAMSGWKVRWETDRKPSGQTQDEGAQW